MRRLRVASFFSWKKKPFNLGGNRIGWTRLVEGFGEGTEHELTISALNKSGIENQHHTPVGGGADQPAEALFELHRRILQGELEKSASAGGVDRITPSFKDRVGWNGEGKLGDHDQPKGVAGASTLPRRRRSQTEPNPALQQRFSGAYADQAPLD